MEDYINNRVDDQIRWYDTKAINNKRLFHIFKIVELILSGVIPVLILLIKIESHKNITIAIIGFLILLVSSIQSIFKFNENWISYRTTAEQLKHEKQLYLNNVSEYRLATKDQIFVSTIESLISKENSDWRKKILKGNIDENELSG